MSEYAVATARDTVRIERLLPGPIERVWDYLTDPEKRATWFAGGPIEPRAGGTVTLRFHNNALTPDDGGPGEKWKKYGGELTSGGRVTEWDPPRLLAFLWGEEDGTASEVRIELAPKGSKVQLVLTHQRLRDREGMLNVSGGWHAHLDVLVARLEGTTPPGFWPAIARLEKEYQARIP